jgi:hypothetical protein
MIRNLLAFRSPADVEREERERVMKRLPHQAFTPMSRPARDHFAWRDIAEALPVEGD